MRRVVVVLAVLAGLVGSAQARADAGAQVSVWSEAGEIGMGAGPSTIDQNASDPGSGGVAHAAWGWPLALPFPAAAGFPCASTGCAANSGGATASADEAAGVLKAGAGASLLVGNPPDSNYGGDAQVSSDASVSDSITLSKAATVWIEGTVHGTLSSDNSDENQLLDPRSEIDVKVDLCCVFRYESIVPIGGFEQQYEPAANGGPTTVDDTFSVPVDLPAGTTGFDAELKASTDMLVDGVSGLVLADDSLLDFDGTVTFHVRVPDDVVATSDTGLLPIVGGASAADVVPPSTTETASPEPQWQDWNGGPVTVHLAATDTGGSGVQSITYSASGAQPIASTSVTGDSVDVPISAEGVTTLTYFATDAAGNAEAPQTATVKIDTTGPSSTASVSPQPNAAGWNDTPVTVTLSADDGSGVGVEGIDYRWSGAANSSGVTAAGDTASMTFSTDYGATTITYHAIDRLGNAGPEHTVTVRLDRLPPTVTLPGYGGVLTVDATDPDGATVSYDLHPVDNVDPSPTASCDHPSGSVFGIGETHVTCNVSDVAGNVLVATFIVDVRGAAEQIDLELWVHGPGMSGKVEAAYRAAEAGHVRAACGALGAYIRELGAITGKWVDAQTAAEKLRDAERIRRVLGCG